MTKISFLPGKCRAQALLCSFFTVLAGAFSQFGVHAATYYVDYSAGGDTNNGTATNAAWQHCPGDTNASSVAKSTTFHPGDTVILKGGVQYMGAILLPWSGTSNNPITYDGNSAGTFGTGRAVLNGNYSSNQLYGLATTNYPFGYTQPGISNVLFNDLEIACIGGHTNVYWTCTNLPPKTINYAMFLCNCYGVTVSNCYMHDIGDWTNSANMNLVIMNGSGIIVQGGGTNITITSCEFTHLGKAAINLNTVYGAITNVLIYQCNMHDFITWGVNIACSQNNGTMCGITIDGMIWHDYYQYSGPMWNGCAGYWPHTDGIICYLANNPMAANCSLGTPAAPIIVRNSYFYNNDTNSANDCAGTADIYLDPWGGSFWIYNNVFCNVLNKGEGCIDFYWDVPGGNGSTPPDFRVYNNTMYDSNRCFVLCYGVTNNNGTLDVENNLFENIATSGGTPMGFGANTETNFATLTNISLTLNHNYYYEPSSTWQMMYMGPSHSSPAGISFTALQSLGYETNGSWFTNLGFVNTSFGIGGYSSLNDLHLLSNSPAIQAGVNLSAFFTTDKDGNPRPATGPWDIGAYQYSAPLLPPTNLKVVGP